MKGIITGLANESVLLLALVAATTTALDMEEAWQSVMLAAVPLLLALAVRSVTSSPATVAQVAHTAATATATAIDEVTAGVSGEVTEFGQGIADTVADTVVKSVGGLVSVLAPREKEAA